MLGHGVVKFAGFWSNRRGEGFLRFVLLVGCIAGAGLAMLSAISPNSFSLTNLLNVPYRAISALASR